MRVMTTKVFKCFSLCQDLHPSLLGFSSSSSSSSFLRQLFSENGGLGLYLQIGLFGLVFFSYFALAIDGVFHISEFGSTGTYQHVHTYTHLQRFGRSMS